MVWEKLFTTSSIKSIRFPSNRDVLEDEIFCLQAALRAQIFSYLPEMLYGYRQRPNSIIRSERFAWQIFKGRALCVDVAKKLSNRSAMVAVSAFADTAVNLFIDAQSLPIVDLKPYKALVLEAAENGIIRSKISKRYILFCDHPSRARFFHFKRKVIKAIRFWKDESKEKSIKLTD